MQEKKKLLIICPYPEGVAPSQRLKFEQYFDAFRNAGWQIREESFISLPFWNIIYKKGRVLAKAWFTLKGYLKRIALLSEIREYDVVYVHLWVTPFGPPLFERWIKKRARKLVYDIDDLVYLKPAESKAHPIAGLLKGRQKPLYLIASADHVITCTPYLDEFVRKFNTSTTDISSTVDTDKRYRVVNNYRNKDIITIGWSGSVSTAQYLYLLENIFRKLATRFRFRVLAMGDPNLRMEGVDLEAVPWKESYEMEVLGQFDIGVYPLPEEEWVLGKSGLKAIQYMALGIPTVATAIGANFRVIEDGVSGYLVKTEDEWIEALSRLMEDEELRRRIGMNARKRVEERFSIRANKDTYLRILEEV